MSHADLTRAMLDGPCTYAELQSASGYSYDAVNRWIQALRTTPQQVRVAAWERDSMGRASIQVFAFGTEPDVKKPKVVSGADRTARWKARRVRDNAAALHAVFYSPVLPEREIEVETV